MGFVKAPTELIESLRKENRVLSKQEAHLILTDDMNLNRPKNISEYSREWGWSRRSVRRFILNPKYPFDNNGLWTYFDIEKKYAHPKRLRTKALGKSAPTLIEFCPPHKTEQNQVKTICSSGVKK